MCDQISTMICKYWWSSQDKENKMHWMRWETLTKPKKEDGLGFRDIHTFNLAMLAKQGWRLLQNPGSLCAQVLGAKYFPAGDVMKAQCRSGASYTWNSIHKGIQLLKNGLIWRIGNGRSVNIWKYPWIPWEWTRQPMTPRGNNLISTVDELIDPTTGDWDKQLVHQTFAQADAQTILAIPVHPDLEDVPAWHYDARGLFSVRSAYKVQKEHNQRRSRRCSQSSSRGSTLESEHWGRLWKMKCPGKIKHFFWRLAHDLLALRMNLERRGMELDTRCVMCNRRGEEGGVRPGAAGLLMGIECSRVRDSSWMYLTSIVNYRIGVALAAVQGNYPIVL